MQRKFKFALCIFHAIVALFCTASAADIYISADGDVPCRSAIWNIPRHRLSYPCNGQPLKAQTKIQQKNRAQARFFYILRTVLDNSAQSVYNYDSADLRSFTVTADSGTSRKAVVYIKK